MSPSRAAIAALLVLAACGRGAPVVSEGVPDVGCAPDRSPCFLFDHLDRFDREGGAASLSELPTVEPEVLFGVDFDDGTLGVLSVRGGDGVAPADGVLELPSKGAKAWLESEPIAVDAERRYTMTWRETASGVRCPGQNDGKPAGVSVRFLNGSKELDTPRTARWRPVEGTVAWRRVDRSFRAPSDATHAVVVVHAPRGSDAIVAVDDLGLVATRSPAWEGRTMEVWSEPGASPAVRRVRGGGAAHDKAKEVRTGVLVPAPSTLRTKLTVPEGGRLTLGYGLMKGAATRKKVRFTARLADASGTTHELLKDSIRGSWRPDWRDEEIDLSRWAGQTVTLELATSGRDSTGDVMGDIARSPEARAVWTTARLEGAPARRKLAILVIVDTLGAAHASAWDATRTTTPNLERIADAGVVFEQARAPAPWTLPSIASYLTGLDPDRHRAGQMAGRDHWNRRLVPRSTATVAERLREAGWQTGAWMNNPFLAPRNSALDQGFDRYVDYGTRSRQHAAAAGVDQAIAELERGSGADRFLVVHLMDPHGPYRPDAEHKKEFVDGGYDGVLKDGMETGQYLDIVRQRLDMGDADKQQAIDLHEAVVAWSDLQIGRLWDAAAGSGDELLFLVTSDHGEEFWEHDRYEHGQSLYRELLHVPLLAAGDGWPQRERVPTPVTATAVAGTVLQFAGLPLGGMPALAPQMNPEPLHGGRVLYGLGQRTVEEHGFKYFLRHRHVGRPQKRALQNQPRHQLVDQGEDETETANALKAHPERARELHRLMVRKALPGFDGAWFMAAREGEHVVHFDQVGGVGWWPDTHDFPWPTETGAPYPRAGFAVSRAAEGDRSTVSMTVTAGPVLAVVEPMDGTGTITARRGEVPVAEPLVLEAGELAVAIDALLAGEGPPVLIGRLAGTVAGTGSAGPSAEDLEGLKALGYVE
ncbi:MAG: sulfatase-like hydrolase/transferase [Proteobacteria bacterium]|nr:sulfatase-like hydrolase/transferase [Pseudomonadota bacterium]